MNRDHKSHRLRGRVSSLHFPREGEERGRGEGAAVSRETGNARSWMVQPRVRDNESHEEECLRNFFQPPSPPPFSPSGLHSTTATWLSHSGEKLFGDGGGGDSDDRGEFPSLRQRPEATPSPWTSGSRPAARSRNYVVDIMQIRRPSTRRISLRFDKLQHLRENSRAPRGT